MCSIGHNENYAAIVNLGIYVANYVLPVEPGKEAWGPTVDLPVIPVGAAQEHNDHIIVWSAWADDQFFASPGGKTLTTTWNPKTKGIEQTVVTNTHHDMFCPGMSMDFDGNIVVSGGGDAGRTSIFNGSGWESGPDMRQPRGYHATSTLSDGRIFAIGDSWSGGSKIKKNGEVYSPRKQKWYTRSGTNVDAMLTHDRLGCWRADNYAWLFGWKNNTVFQAGPSVNMNWFTVEGSGKTVPAEEALTFGGQTSYDGSYASKNAHIITLDSELEEPLVKIAGRGSGNGMKYPRVYHTSVVLPDGKVFTAGGQVWGQPFSESNVQFVPEIYDPQTDTSYPQKSHNFIRVYHSVSVLLPDATVLNGGGGLCGNCSANHYDAQIFTPPYLLDVGGKRRPRPKIVKTPNEETVVGGSLDFVTASFIASAVLIRQGTTTHTGSTDQRRVPLELIAHAFNQYNAPTPKDPGILLPGWYMLSVLDAQDTRSEAAMIKEHLPWNITAEYENEDDEEDEFKLDVDSISVPVEEECEGLEGERGGLAKMITAMMASSNRIWKSWRSAFKSQI